MKLRDLEGGLKAILFSLTLMLCLGNITGLLYLTQSVGTSTTQAIVHYNGDPVAPAPSADEIEEIPENVATDAKTLLSITHSHISSFTLIFGAMGILVWFTKLPTRLKTSLAVEPIWGGALTFGGIWLMRYVHPDFVWLVAISGGMMYSFFFVSALAVLWEICQKRAH